MIGLKATSVTASSQRKDPGWTKLIRRTGILVALERKLHQARSQVGELYSVIGCSRNDPSTIGRHGDSGHLALP